MPFDCNYNSERTSKNPMKIIIDPYKEDYDSKIEFIILHFDSDLEILKEFCNIIYRKYTFQREILHLAKALLYFLYVNEEINLNSFNKKLTSDEEIKIRPELTVKGLIKNKNEYIEKEIDNKFDLLCFGSNQNNFTLKQLLFIADENNDNLEYDSFKKKYENDCSNDLIKLLQIFPDDQLLAAHVKKIKECIEKNPEKISLEKILNEALLINKDYFGEQGNIFSILDKYDKAILNRYERHDNHLIYEKKPKYKIPKNNNLK